MPLKLAPGVRATVARHRLAPPPPPSPASLMNTLDWSISWLWVCGAPKVPKIQKKKLQKIQKLPKHSKKHSKKFKKFKKKITNFQNKITTNPKGRARLRVPAPACPMRTPQQVRNSAMKTFLHTLITHGKSVPSDCWQPFIWDVFLKILDGVHDEALKVALAVGRGLCEGGADRSLVERGSRGGVRRPPGCGDAQRLKWRWVMARRV